MKNNTFLFIGLAIVIIVIGVVVFRTKGNNETDGPIETNDKKTVIEESVSLPEPASRCDELLTLEEAKSISGLAYSKRDVSGQTLGKIVVTTCTYSTPGSSATIKPISILTRLATTTEEAKQIFEESKTVSYKDGQILTDIGNQALWSPSFQQISVLKGQTWIIVTVMKNQELATKIAKEIVTKIK